MDEVTMSISNYGEIHLNGHFYYPDEIAGLPESTQELFVTGLNRLRELVSETLTTLRNTTMTTQVENTEVKRRGRPVGSTNKPKEAAPVMATAAPKRRGRPAGSTNKPKADVAATSALKRRGRTTQSAPVVTAIKRRGRPVGSKNKPKV